MISGAKGKKNTPRKKEKFQIAKSPGQLALGIIIFGIFIGKCVYDGFMAYKAQHPSNSQPTQAENLIAQSPQNGLESLNQDPTGKNVQADANDIYNQTVGLQGKNGAVTTAAPANSMDLPPSANKQMVQGPSTGDDVDIMSSKNPRKRTGKTIMISVSEGGRMNPFLPEGDLPNIGQLNMNITYPPEQLVKDSEASKVMETTISGILFDKYSPSAIINIAKTDYLVRKGDVINNYKVLAIYKDQVVVQLGKNVYRAGVGQLLQQDKVNYNTVANLEKKFGGNNVSVGVKKRGY